MSLPNAITREDFYLNKIANPTDDQILPDAITRRDCYLKAIADSAGGSGLPDVTSSDDGDILAVSSGTWIKSDKLKWLMGVDVSNIGKVPIVGATGEWSLIDYPSNELPTVTTSDNGSVLMVVDGAWSLGHVASPIPISVSDTNMNISVGGSIS